MAWVSALAWMQRAAEPSGEKAPIFTSRIAATRWGSSTLKSQVPLGYGVLPSVQRARPRAETGATSEASTMPTWPHHLAIYGPPGAGKSALIQVARERGYAARDLEDAGSTYEERSTFITALDDTTPATLFGAADLTPADLPEDTRLILLAPSAKELVRRVRGRNDQRTHKWLDHALQVRREHRAMAEQGVFDLVICDDGPPARILDIIVERFAAAP